MISSITSVGSRLRKLPLAVAAAALGAITMPAQAGLIEDFSGDLSNFTNTVILDNGGHSPLNTAAWEISGGLLQLNTTNYVGIEQYAFIYNGLTLSVGQELQADFSVSGSQDFGLYVGGTTPTFNVRQDYVNVYARGDGNIYSRGFDGTAEFTLVGAGVVTYDKLFIARTATDTYELGYYDGATRTVITTRTPTFANGATVVGFYADVRATGILGSADNLTVVPEPATYAMLLGGLGILGVLTFRRRLA
jgi:hypothetical protein